MNWFSIMTNKRTTSKTTFYTVGNAFAFAIHRRICNIFSMIQGATNYVTSNVGFECNFTLEMFSRKMFWQLTFQNWMLYTQLVPKHVSKPTKPWATNLVLLQGRRSTGGKRNQFCVGHVIHGAKKGSRGWVRAVRGELLVWGWNFPKKNPKEIDLFQICRKNMMLFFS